MTKEQVIQNAVSEYFRRSKQIALDALTGHLDRMKDLETETMLRDILGKVYDAARTEK